MSLYLYYHLPIGVLCAIISIMYYLHARTTNHYLHHDISNCQILGEAIAAIIFGPALIMATPFMALISLVLFGLVYTVDAGINTINNYDVRFSVKNKES